MVLALRRFGAVLEVHGFDIMMAAHVPLPLNRPEDA